MTTDDADSGWDSLAQEFGLGTPPPPPKTDKSEPAKSPTRSPTPRPAPDPRPEIEDEVDAFGAGITETPAGREAFYDPGPDAVADDTEEIDDSAPELMDDEDSEDTPEPTEGTTEGEGGKRRRRRRRRKKKGGPGAPEKDTTDMSEAPSSVEEEDDIVEEGEAPAEVEGDDEEPAPPTAVDEEMDAEAAGPRPEWHVMTWMELVSKLYRPS
jgi:hypothetical protein